MCVRYANTAYEDMFAGVKNCLHDEDKLLGCI